MNQAERSLERAVAQNPFPDYQEWWTMGEHFITFMSDSIVSEWTALGGKEESLDVPRHYCADYLAVVYDREIRPTLVHDFVNKKFYSPMRSGEFDALSYAFYRAAFELIAASPGRQEEPLRIARRSFTKRVGAKFFKRVHDYLDLTLPDDLTDRQSVAELQMNIDKVGTFLVEQGYLRDHFAFSFEVDITYGGKQISQTEADFLERVQEDRLAYALYEMGYPAILPSAVYLYNTIGEAQHHSSRTIEELFQRVGYEAREVDDFDPTDYPSDLVVELWEIRRYGL